MTQGPAHAHSERPHALLPLHRLRGKVAHGRKLGRTLGFPTANVPLIDAPPIRYGVYRARVQLADNRRFNGVASVGVNPTVGWVAPILEMFIFDFAEDIYDQSVEVELFSFLREERKFPNLDELVAQIHRDVAAAREATTASG